MAYSDNFEDTMALTAPAGGVTAGTLVFNSTSKAVVLPMTTATSGNTYTGKVMGLVRSAPKVSGSAWTVLRSLSWVSSLSKFKSSTGGSTVASQAVAFNAAASADTTGDVVLRLPCGGLT